MMTTAAASPIQGSRTAPARPHARHHESVARVGAPLQAVFAFLDDHRNLAAHMETSSPMMGGSAMKTEVEGQGLGARVRMSGKMLGLTLALEEEVIEYEPPRRKTLQTLGEPRLLVIGDYCLGFDLRAEGAATRVCVWIDYDLPRNKAIERWLGRLLGGFYARWCTEQMLKACTDRFGLIVPGHA